MLSFDAEIKIFEWRTVGKQNKTKQKPTKPMYFNIFIYIFFLVLSFIFQFFERVGQNWALIVEKGRFC